MNLNLGSGKYLLPSFFSLLIFMTAIYATGCSPYLLSLRGYPAAISGIFMALGAAASIFLFVFSWIACQSYLPVVNPELGGWGVFKAKVKLLMQSAALPLFLFVYGASLRYFLPMICAGYVYKK